MWQPGWEGDLGANGCIYMYDWVPLLSTKKKKKRKYPVGVPWCPMVRTRPFHCRGRGSALVRKVRSQATQPKKKRKERTRNCAKILVLTAPGQPHGHAQLDGIPERESASLVQMASLTCPLPREHMFRRHVQDVESDGPGPELTLQCERGGDSPGPSQHGHRLVGSRCYWNPMRSYLENPMDRGAWWATVRGVAESDTTETNTPPPQIHTPRALCRFSYAMSPLSETQLPPISTCRKQPLLNAVSSGITKPWKPEWATLPCAPTAPGCLRSCLLHHLGHLHQPVFSVLEQDRCIHRDHSRALCHQDRSRDSGVAAKPLEYDWCDRETAFSLEVKGAANAKCTREKT